MKCSPFAAVPALLVLSSFAFAQEPAQPTQSHLEAGGLRPPEAIDATPQADPNAATPEKELAKADEEDAGRGLEWVWLNLEVGGQHLGLQTLKSSDLVDPKLVKTTQTGLVYGVGAGLRILVFTVGARFRLSPMSDWQLWTLDAEGGLRVPIGNWEPYFTLGVGYASIGSFSADAPAASKADIKGLNARLGAGIDYYLSNTFSVGANFTGDLLFLSRSAVSGASGSEAEVYGKDGSSIGLGTALTAVVGMHF
jgi:hypothetical protein